MGARERVALYREIEVRRQRPLIVYVTSERVGADGQIGADAVREMHYQLEALPADATALDLLLVSNGGDPTVAWRIVSLIRERVKKLSVLIPQAAYSAATLIALGADEIVMHPNGNLGPTDPQITVRTKRAPDGPVEEIKFGSEDLSAFLRFAREEVGLSDQAHLLKVFAKFCEAVGAIPIGVAARSSQLSLSMGEKLLLLHMTSDAEKQKARAIAETLTKDFFHHGYPVSRTEAENIGLRIAKRDADIESLIWRIWLDVADELLVREPFLPMKILKASPQTAPLFAPVPQAVIPANLPPAIAQQALTQVLAQVQVQQVPPVPFETIHAVIESPRYASRFLIRGNLFATRLPDLQIKITQTKEEQGWQTIGLPAAPRPRKAARRKKKRAS
jgi:hypothetical protein